MERQLMAQMYKVIYDCPKCEEGEMNCMENTMRLIISFGKPPSAPRPLAHQCNKCGWIMGLQTSYPHVRCEPLELEGIQTDDGGHA